MPCDTVSTVSVDFGKIADPKLLEQSIKDLGYHTQINGDVLYVGYNSRINLKTGQAELESGLNVNTIKQNYSKTVLKTQAKRFGWQVKEAQNGTFEVVKARRL